MGFAFSGSITAFAYSTTSLSTVGGVDIALGDLVVVVVKNNGANVISGLTDSAGNTYTAVDQRFGSNATIRFFYCIATNDGTGVTHTATMATATAQPTMAVAVFTPDAGDTVSLDVDVYNTAGWASSPWVTPAGDTTGDDAIAIVACQSNGDETWSNHQIGGTATGVNVITSPDLFGQTWYRILTETVSGCTGYVELAGGGQQAIEMLVFKAVSSGGGSGAISGTSEGMSTVSGTLTGTGALSGASEGASVLSGVLTGTGSLSGSSSGGSTVSAILSGTGSLSGSAAGTCEITALLSGVGSLNGLSEGSCIVSGTLHNAAPTGNLQGVAAGSSIVTGTLQAKGALSGLSAGTVTVTGTLSGVGALSGQAAGVATLTGTLRDGANIPIGEITIEFTRQGTGIACSVLRTGITASVRGRNLN